MVEGAHRRGPAVPPRPASSVMLVRAPAGQDAGPFEVLLVRRSPEARFIPGVWVFPGGVVRGDDGPDPDSAHRRAALRELAEEAAIELPGDEALVAFSRWITPAPVSVRFDTRFYLAEAPPEADPRPDGVEVVEAEWLAPADALGRHRRGDMPLIFPTIKHLERLAACATVAEAFAAAPATPPEPVEPRIVEGPGGPAIVLPGDPGWE